MFFLLIIHRPHRRPFTLTLLLQLLLLIHESLDYRFTTRNPLNIYWHETLIYDGHRRSKDEGAWR